MRYIDETIELYNQEKYLDVLIRILLPFALLSILSWLLSFVFWIASVLLVPVLLILLVYYVIRNH